MKFYLGILIREIIKTFLICVVENSKVTFYYVCKKKKSLCVSLQKELLL